MPNAPVATEIHESLDVHRNFKAEVARDREHCNHVAQARDLGQRQVHDLRARLDAGRFSVN
jgi:hypothetical protein